MKRLVFILLDGLCARTARRCMSYLSALTESGAAAYTELSSVLPPLSRPVYTLLLSGLKPLESAILHNESVVSCPAATIFHKARSQGLVTAAAAYVWMSELCNRVPFVANRDRFTADPALPISYGLFYSSDAYPDDELFHDAEWLCREYAPQLFLVHSMGIDYAGHNHGSDSEAYRDAARTVDGLLARCLPRWLEAGYAALITSDHGMDSGGKHYDATDEVLRVPFWFVGDMEDIPLPQEQGGIAGMIAKYLRLN